MRNLIIEFLEDALKCMKKVNAETYEYEIKDCKALEGCDVKITLTAGKKKKGE